MRASIPTSVFAALILLSSCRTRSEYTSRPQGEVEGPEILLVAHHLSDSLTKVYMTLSNESLLYKRPDTSVSFYTQLRVHYQLAAENSWKVIDSSTFYMFDIAAGEHVKVKNLQSEFAVSARHGNLYSLQVELWDLNRRARYSKTIAVNRLDRINAQNFLVRSGDTIAFNRYFTKE